MVKPEDFIKFKVSEDQRSFAYKVGMARFKSKNGCASTRNLSPINSHVCGATAEVVFGHWQGFPVDESIHATKGDKFDFISRCGETTDVKHSTYHGPGIELKEKVENVDAGKLKDIYVLCRAVLIGKKRISEVWVIGWITQANFITKNNRGKRYGSPDDNYPENYVAGLDQLEPFVGKEYGMEVDLLVGVGT